MGKVATTRETLRRERPVPGGDPSSYQDVQGNSGPINAVFGNYPVQYTVPQLHPPTVDKPGRSRLFVACDLILPEPQKVHASGRGQSQKAFKRSTPVVGAKGLCRAPNVSVHPGGK